jgi:hypothetical protein
VTLALWASLHDLKARMRPRFTLEGGTAPDSSFPDGLLGSEPCKTSWMRAAAATSFNRTQERARLPLPYVFDSERMEIPATLRKRGKTLGIPVFLAWHEEAQYDSPAW